MRWAVHGRRRALVAVGAGVLVVAAVGGYALVRSRPAATAAPDTAQVQRGAVTLLASAAGTVEAVGTRGLSFSVTGTVTEVGVHPGDRVTAGQVLARIDPADAQAAVTSARSALDSANDALTRAGSSGTSSGTAAATCPAALAAYPVPAGTATAPAPSPSASGPAPRPSASATATASPSPSAGRGGTGTGAGTGTGTGGTGTGGSGSRTGNSCGSTGGTGSGSTSGSSGARSGQTSNPDGILSAQEQVNNAELNLELAEAKLAGTVITAPIAGTVLSVGGAVGSRATPGGTGFVVLSGVAAVAIRADFSEADVADLAVGQTATITLPDRDGAQYAGRVSQVDPAGTVSGRLVRYGVVLAFDEAPADLLIGSSATVAVTTGSVPNALYVPSGAVHAGAVTIRVGGRDEQRAVRVGLRGDRYTEILSGLAAGDTVVLGGQQ